MWGGLAPPEFLPESLVVAAGTTVYLACGDIIPAIWVNTLQNRRTLTPALGVGLGVSLMWMAALLERTMLS